VYALGGDGCMMEGISSEAASLAAHLKLSNLCWIYDSNRITIEGGTPLAFSEDVGARFAAYGWNVTHVTDANDLDMIRGGFRTFLQTGDRPTLIVVNSHIGWGSPHKQDSHTAHGEPLGEEEIRLTKRNYGWPEDAKFLVPDGVYEHFQSGIGKRGKELRGAWSAGFEAYKTKFPAWRTGSFPTDGTRTFHHFPPMRRVWQRATPPAKSRMRSPKMFPGFLAAPRTSRRRPRRFSAEWPISKLEIMPDEICTSASASTPWPRSSMA